MSDNTENTIKKQRHGFQPGQSGNPAGRPKGARNRTTMAAEALLAGEAETITRRAIDLALAGDRVALKLCIDRIYPKPRDAPIKIKLPQIISPKDILYAIDTIFRMVSEGYLTPIEARTLSSVIADQGRAIERADLEKRIDALEQNS